MRGVVVATVGHPRERGRKMALLRLVSEEMVQLSAPWVTPDNEAHTIVMSVPLLAALLPQLDGAHRLLMSMIPAADSPKFKELSAAEAELDVRHDTLVRGIYGGLTSVALISASGEELLSLRDFLLPEGLAHTQKSYRGEAGHAALVEPRLDANTRKRLAAVTLHDRTLEALVDEWLSVAKQLGALEELKAKLVGPAGNSALEISQARFGWIRVVKALLSNAELVPIDEDQDRVLFGALHAAELAADRRKRSRPAAADGSEDTAGSEAKDKASQPTTSAVR